MIGGGREGRRRAQVCDGEGGRRRKAQVCVIGGGGRLRCV